MCRTWISRGLVFAALIAVAMALPQRAHAAETQKLYRLGGNHFILRETREGGASHIRVYRQAGDQWERFGASTAREGAAHGGIAGEVLRRGQYLGTSTIDLDDWMNTDLNRTFPEVFR